jgi:hypothetical protein
LSSGFRSEAGQPTGSFRIISMYEELKRLIESNFEPDLSERILIELRISANEALKFLGRPQLPLPGKQSPAVIKRRRQWYEWATDIRQSDQTCPVREIARQISERTRSKENGPYRSPDTVREIISALPPFNTKGNQSLEFEAMRKRIERLYRMGPQRAVAYIELVAQITPETMRKLNSSVKRDILRELGGLEETNPVVRDFLSTKKRQSSE